MRSDGPRRACRYMLFFPRIRLCNITYFMDGLDHATLFERQVNYGAAFNNWAARNVNCYVKGIVTSNEVVRHTCLHYAYNEFHTQLDDYDFNT